MRAERQFWTSTAVGAAAALGAMLVGLGSLAPMQTAASAVLAGLMGAIAAEDRRHYHVPDGLNAVAAVSGLAFAWVVARAEGGDGLAALAKALLQMVLCGGALLLVREVFFRLRGVDGLGLGDVKLGAAAGAWVGAEAFALAVMVAAVAALVFVAVHHRRQGGWKAERRIPFAFYLAPAIWASWFMIQFFPAP